MGQQGPMQGRGQASPGPVFPSGVGPGLSLPGFGPISPGQAGHSFAGFIEQAEMKKQGCITFLITINLEMKMFLIIC